MIKPPISENERIRKVTVVKYDPQWKALFEAESAEIADVLGKNSLEIFHIGSTAIPFIRAKPIVDILLVVKNLSQLDDVADKMLAIGYQPMGEYGIAGRRFYFKTVNGIRLCHLHAFEVGNTEIERHKNFIAYLFKHPDIARQYSLLKEQLAKKFPNDIESYVQGKNDFIKHIDAQVRSKLVP